MKNSITHCPPRTNTFSKNVLGFMKTLLMLITFVGLSQFAIAQTPACNIEGPLQGCAITDPDETRNDILITVNVAQSGHNPTLVYDIPAGSNLSGAFIRSYGDTIYDGDFNSLTQTLTVFPGTSNGGFLLTLDVKNEESGGVNSCSKSVTIFQVTVGATFDPIACFGGTTQLNVTGTSAPVSPMTFTVSPDGGVKVDNSSPYAAAYPGLTGTLAGKVYSIEAKNSFGCVATTERTIFEPAQIVVDLDCPADKNEDACQTQAAINQKFQDWLNSFDFSVTGADKGDLTVTTDPATPTAPDACGGSTEVKWTVTGRCSTEVSCTRTFTVGEGTELTVSCPGNVSLDPCTSTEDIQDAYDAWVAGFKVNGGCDPSSNIADIPALPSDIACGGKIEFTLIAQNAQGACDGRDECTASFEVGTAPELVTTCPGNVSLDPCTSLEDIQDAYDAWKAGFKVEGGCSPSSNIANIPALPSDIACGGKIEFTLSAENGEGYCPGSDECTSSFEVGTAPELVTTCPGNVSLDPCTSLEDIQDAYDAWKAGFKVEGGCSASSNIANIPALPSDIACGGKIEFTLSAENGEGYCPGSDECTSSFEVGTAPELDAICPGDVKLEACLSSSAITEAYNAWKAGFKVEGGCSPTSNINEIPGLPEDIACGGKIEFTLIAQNAEGKCAGRDECTSTFEVAVGQGTEISLTCADDKEVSCTGELSFDEPTPAGGCGTVTVEVKGSDVEVTNPDGTVSVTRTWEAVDGCGNKAECSQKITRTCCSSIGDLVWKDDNNNGIQDGGEVGVANVTVTLYKCDGTMVSSQSTDGSGNYLFTNLCAGRYYVKFSDIPSGYVFSPKDAGSDDCKDSDADGTTGQTDCFSLAENENNTCVDAGVKPPVEYWGCTPGFWKNHPAGWDQASDPISACIAAAAAGLGYGGNGTTSALFRTTFGLTAAEMTAVGYNANLTLLQAVSSGGGGFQKLARHGVSSLLNTCGITEHFPVNAQSVITDIHNAVINKTPEPFASKFAAYNEQDPDICPKIDNKNKSLRVPGEELVREESTILVFPTPANTLVNIDMIFNTAKEAVTLEIYNVNGQRLAVLFNSSADANFEYHTEFNVSTLPSGAYFYRLSADGETKMGKLSVVR